MSLSKRDSVRKFTIEAMLVGVSLILAACSETVDTSAQVSTESTQPRPAQSSVPEEPPPPEAFSKASEFATNGPVRAFAELPDGRVFVGGFFTQWDGVRANGLVLLAPDGSLDSSFSGPEEEVSVEAIVVQDGGQFVVGGTFTSWNGVKVNHLVRLSITGEVDVVFAKNVGAGAYGTVSALALQSDGKIVVGGTFDKWGAVMAREIVRLSADGELDVEFVQNIQGGPEGSATVDMIWQVGVGPTGEIMAAGNFLSWAGQEVPGFARLYPTGELDSWSTTLSTILDSVSGFAFNRDSLLLIGGTRDSTDYKARAIEFLRDGSVNQDFRSGAIFDEFVFADYQSHGRITLGGMLGWSGKSESFGVVIFDPTSTDNAPVWMYPVPSDSSVTSVHHYRAQGVLIGRTDGVSYIALPGLFGPLNQAPALSPRRRGPSQRLEVTAQGLCLSCNSGRLERSMFLAREGSKYSHV